MLQQFVRELGLAENRRLSPLLAADLWLQKYGGAPLLLGHTADLSVGERRR